MKNLKRIPPILEPFASLGRGLSYLFDHGWYMLTGIYRCEFCYRKFGLKYEMYEVTFHSNYIACEECYKKYCG